MNMEKFGGKKEPLVPEEKQAEFAVAAAEGDEQKSVVEEKSISARLKRDNADQFGLISTVVGAGTLSAGFSGNLPAALGGAAMLGGLALGRRANLKDAAKFDKEAQTAEIASEQAYAKSRGIVEEGMKQGGAEEVEGQLRATPEQIEFARKEMEEKYGGGESQ